ncbi:uncharacterized protein MELLADRAFT_114128 [Melampsora larici-populina 98AG31]|uniref:Uncharacterized protein n=1 Tax=Melampsora larici-populina (strain 98AG31 / pathotype 3-4-7) TaxID=747676 RepID=F4SC95_MELLP|nr:uncharacterized protein MELLADRAFT_114128 [Melampsora larici-populina 98AG31]EGF97731.1 hypothetical protein MELLADRAFT_114128 [Melampsora larici-populina 98AG31]
MVCPTLIHAHYEKAKPHILTLPTPDPRGRRGPTGLLCPVCSTEMVYHTANYDSWLIGCPTPNNGHNWKTWRCDQLNHELALINLGTARPIISVKSDWGPRVSPKGEVLDDAPAPQPSNGRYQPYSKNRSHARTSPAKTGLLCKRIYEGKVSQNHKKAANKECPHQYCLGCCTAYGSMSCSKHSRSSKVAPIQPKTQEITHQTLQHLGITAQQFTQLSEIQASKASTPRQQTATGSAPRRSAPSPAPASASNPHKWAQFANTLGQRMPIESIVMLQKNRADRAEADNRKKETLIDTAKMATISLWVNSAASKPIAAYFPQWPVVYLNQSDLLLQAVTTAVGPEWDGALSVWDHTLNSWMDTMVNYPHQLPDGQRSIIVRLPNVDVPHHALMPSAKVLNKGSPGNLAIPASAFLSKKDLPAICENQLSTDQTSTASPSNSQEQPHPNNSPIGNLLGESTQQTIPSSIARPATPPTRIEVDLTLSPTPTVEERQDKASPSGKGETKGKATVTSASPKRKKGWPAKTELLSSLVAWYYDTLDGDPRETWVVHFGDQWVLTKTMYRYRAWVELVGPETMQLRFNTQPGATVAEARDFWSDEFKKVSGHGKGAAHNEEDSQAQS